MPSMTAFEFGDVILVRFPFTDRSAASVDPRIKSEGDNERKQRPAVDGGIA